MSLLMYHCHATVKGVVTSGRNVWDCNICSLKTHACVSLISLQWMYWDKGVVSACSRHMPKILCCFEGLVGGMQWISHYEIKYRGLWMAGWLARKLNFRKITFLLKFPMASTSLMVSVCNTYLHTRIYSTQYTEVMFPVSLQATQLVGSGALTPRLERKSLLLLLDPPHWFRTMNGWPTTTYLTMTLWVEFHFTFLLQ